MYTLKLEKFFVIKAETLEEYIYNLCWTVDNLNQLSKIDTFPSCLTYKSFNSSTSKASDTYYYGLYDNVPMLSHFIFKIRVELERLLINTEDYVSVDHSIYRVMMKDAHLLYLERLEQLYRGYLM